MRNQILNVGVAAFTLMIPILAGYIAYAIGDRPARWHRALSAAGSSTAASTAPTPVPASIGHHRGLLVGYLVRWIATRHYHKMMQPAGADPDAPSSVPCLSPVFIFIIVAPHCRHDDGSERHAALHERRQPGAEDRAGGRWPALLLTWVARSTRWPSSSRWHDGLGQTQFMGAMACAIPAAPLGMSLATVLGVAARHLDATEIRRARPPVPWVLVGISEGRFTPPVIRSPSSTSNVLGSATAVMAFPCLASPTASPTVAHRGPGCSQQAAAGLLCMICGAIVSGGSCPEKLRIKKSDEVTLAKAA